MKLHFCGLGLSKSPCNIVNHVLTAPYDVLSVTQRNDKLNEAKA